MNIRDAKQEIVDAVRTYLEKDETGSYEIPVHVTVPEGYELAGDVSLTVVSAKQEAATEADQG